MARVTVEDCVRKVPNRFELVLAASQRARQIGAGSPLTVERDNDKNPVVALREIANSKVEVEALKEGLINSFRVQTDSEPEEDEISEFVAQETMRFQQPRGSVTLEDEDLDEEDIEDEEETSSHQDE